MKLHPYSVFICGIFVSLSLFSTQLSADESSVVNDSTLVQYFQRGKLDTLREILEEIPELTAGGQFLRGIFEEDGEKARFYFDHTVALYSGSVYEVFALERLWQYHLAKGDMEMSRKYWDFLCKRHPEHPCVENPPRFDRESDLRELTVEVVRGNRNVQNANQSEGYFWSVQLGAFSNFDGALRVKKIAEKWGEVKISKKAFHDRELTIVQVGNFKNRSDAVDLETMIRSGSELRGKVIKVKAE